MPLIVQNSKGEVSELDIPNVRLVEGFQVTLLKPQELYEYFGFKVDIYSCKIIDENSRMAAEIKEDDSMIPDVASMTFALESSALCFATATTWHKRFDHQNMEFIKRMSSNPLFNNLRVSDEEFQDS